MNERTELINTVLSMTEEEFWEFTRRIQEEIDAGRLFADKEGVA